MDELEIFCPHCKWRPGHEDRWVCHPGCSAVWNAFWTRGLCPGCAKQWEVTQCLACRRIAPHKKWYHLPQPGRARTPKKRVPAAV